MTVAERPAWVDDELFPFTSRFVDVDGHRLHYVDEGSGPTLLFLHIICQYLIPKSEVVLILNASKESIWLVSALLFLKIFN